LELTDEQRETLDKVNESHLHDPARAMDSLKNHSATALRSKVLAQEAKLNGRREEARPFA
jgi:hypothetical protein